MLQDGKSKARSCHLLKEVGIKTHLDSVEEYDTKIIQKEKI